MRELLTEDTVQRKSRNTKSYSDTDDCGTVCQSIKLKTVSFIELRMPRFS